MEDDEPEYPPIQLSEHRLSGARKPLSTEDDPEDEPPIRWRRLEEEQVVITVDEEYDSNDEDEEDEEYEEGVCNEDNDLGEEANATYNPRQRVASAWGGEHWELMEI